VKKDISSNARKDWSVKIAIDEHDGYTRAKARLRWRNQGSTGLGLARLNPADRDIGDELAVARALADLATQLMSVAARDIEAVTNQPVSLL
jgi:hypothetical protein